MIELCSVKYRQIYVNLFQEWANDPNTFYDSIDNVYNIREYIDWLDYEYNLKAVLRDLYFMCSDTFSVDIVFENDEEKAAFLLTYL